MHAVCALSLSGAHPYAPLKSEALFKTACEAGLGEPCHTASQYLLGIMPRRTRAARAHNLTACQRRVALLADTSAACLLGFGYEADRSKPRRCSSADATGLRPQEVG